MTPTLSTLLDDVVDRYFDQAALVSDGVTVTYRVLGETADAVAAQLPAVGCGPDDRVAVVAPNSTALVAGMLSTWRLDGVVVPLSSRLRQQDLEAALRATRPTAIVTIGAYGGFDSAAHAVELLPSLPGTRAVVVVGLDGAVARCTTGGPPATAIALPAGTGMILATSGSTGAPKGTVVSHARELAASAMIVERLQLRVGEVTLLPVPASHAFGLTCLLSTLRAGGVAVLIDGARSGRELMTVATRYGASVVHGPPTLYAAMPVGEVSSPLRRGLVAGAPSPPAVLERLDLNGIRLLNLYGMTELGAVACPHLDDAPDVRYSSCGQPVCGYELRVGDAGDVQARGAHATAGYLGRPDLSAEAFDGSWFRTGDLGALEDGVLRIIGRRRDVANVGGFSVSPAEVEACLLDHPGIVAAVVVAVDDAVRGDRLEAFVVSRSDTELTRQDVLRHTRSRLAGYKVPYRIHVEASLPELPSGKPDREALRSRVRGC